MKYKLLWVGLCLMTLLSLSGRVNLMADDSPDSEEIVPFYPVRNKQEKKLDKNFLNIQVNNLKEKTKHDQLFFKYIMAYAAVRENDLSLCANVGKNKKCADRASDLMVMRNLAEKRCKDMPSRLSSLCSGMDNCDNLVGWEKDVCQGYNSGDLSLVKRGQTSYEHCAGSRKYAECDWENENGPREALAIYQGFKYYSSKKACEKYARGLEGHRAYACEVMFSTSPLNDILDGVAKDLAYYVLSEQYKDSSLCENIKGENLKSECYSSGRKSLDKFW